MKLILVLSTVFLLSMTSAEEHPEGNQIQLCGADLAHAMHQVCDNGNLGIFNIQHAHKHHHEYNHEGHEWKRREEKGYAMKRDASYTLADECCQKPCYFKDFVSYCSYEDS